MSSCDSPLELGDLVAYRNGELAAEREHALEEHYFRCETCAARLAWVESLSDAVAELVRTGAVSTVVSAEWVALAKAQHVSIRTYTLSPGGSVDCTAAPTDDFVLIRLKVGTDCGRNVDVETEFTDLPTSQTEKITRENLFVDAITGEILYAFSGEEVRHFPRSRWVMHVRAHGDPSQSRGPFTMNHTPWDELHPSQQ